MNSEMNNDIVEHNITNGTLNVGLTEIALSLAAIAVK
jgi:hypothetical protein